MATKKEENDGKAKKSASETEKVSKTKKSASETEKVSKTKKSASKKEYDSQAITALKGADRIRKRPAVMFGSDGLDGCEHSFFEILSNSVDEAREGYGSEISVRIYRDHVIEIDDHGRGVPLGYNEKEKQYNWFLIYCEMYAGGKYENNSGVAAYTYSLGLNGLGACATQCSSEFMEVFSYDGEHESYMHFTKGNPDGELRVRDLSRSERRTGTLTRWKPDLEVFTDINIPHEYFTDVLNRQAMVNAGIRFRLAFENEDGSFTDEEFYFADGIVDYVRALVGDDALTAPVKWQLETRGRDREDMPEYKLLCEVAFCSSNKVQALEYYHNSSYLEHGGSPEKAVRLAFTTAVDRYLKAQGKYNKNEAKVTFQDIADCLVLVTNSFSTQTSYANQTKKAITNQFIADAMNAFLKEKLEIYFVENPLEAERFCGQVLVNKRSRETAEKTRIDIKSKITSKMDIANRVDKFVSCRSKDATRRELFIVEGDSALTSVKLGRDAEFQAIIPVRGKTLNCLKSSYDKIFKSEIITNLLKVIGCGVEVKTKTKGGMVPFSMDDLKWAKIIICTDADEDGFQIRTLLLTMFYRLLPTLLLEGRVYIAESPLYEITCGSDTYFAYNEPEKAQILASIGDKKYTLQRSKGLGENEPEMMWKTTMNPETRRLIRITRSDAEATARIFETLLGDDIAARKEFIAENGSRYLDLADI